MNKGNESYCKDGPRMGDREDGPAIGDREDGVDDEEINDWRRTSGQGMSRTA